MIRDYKVLDIVLLVLMSLENSSHRSLSPKLSNGTYFFATLCCMQDKEDNEAVLLTLLSLVLFVEMADSI